MNNDELHPKLYAELTLVVSELNKEYQDKVDAWNRIKEDLTRKRTFAMAAKHLEGEAFATYERAVIDRPCEPEPFVLQEPQKSRINDATADTAAELQRYTAELLHYTSEVKRYYAEVRRYLAAMDAYKADVVCKKQDHTMAYRRMGEVCAELQAKNEEAMMIHERFTNDIAKMNDSFHRYCDMLRGRVLMEERERMMTDDVSRHCCRKWHHI